MQQSACFFWNSIHCFSCLSDNVNVIILFRILFAVPTGLEPAPRTVTGWHCQPFNHETIYCGPTWIRTTIDGLTVHSNNLYTIGPFTRINLTALLENYPLVCHPGWRHSYQIRVQGFWFVDHISTLYLWWELDSNQYPLWCYLREFPPRIRKLRLPFRHPIIFWFAKITKIFLLKNI